jgi:hypothetical protein
MNMCHQYTCPAAGAPTRKWRLAGALWVSGEPREQREMGGRKTPKIMDYAFSLSKSRLKAPASRLTTGKTPVGRALNK